MKKSLLIVAAAVGLVVIASVAIWKASDDDSRRQGALGGGEPVTLSWNGDWNAERDYRAGSVVNYEGASYVAESEELSTPKPDCIDCGWARIEGSSEEPKGADAVSPGYEIRGEYSESIPPNGFTVQATLCPLGKKVLGGGFNSIALTIEVSQPVQPDDAHGNGRYGWRVDARNGTGQARQVLVYAICSDAS